ncbi:triple tyrosine motif-containing protein [Granulicella sibirica]|nr:triple tyrosine motif-containing protein [Granulicella sibirica]
MLDEGKSVLIGTGFKTRVMLARLSPRGLEPIPTPLLTSGIHQMFRDPRGTVWLNADGKSVRLNGATSTAVQGPADISEGEFKIRSITTDAAGSLWVSILSNGPDLIYTLRDGIWTRFHGLDDAGSFQATSMMTDHVGRVWIATGASRIFMIEDGKARSFDRQQGVDSGGTTLLFEHGDHVWVGGTDNLDYFSDGRFRRISSEDGSQLPGVTGVEETSNGDVWMNSARGIVHMTSLDLRNGLREERPWVHATILDYLDGGFESPRVSSQASTTALTFDGLIYFVSRQGVMSIDPSHTDTNRILPGIAITSAVADRRRYDNPVAIDLDKGSQNLQINYTASSLLIPERVHFRYKLEGFDKDWLDVGTRRQAFYTHLPPGRYAFLVIASNNDGVWSKAPARWDFSLPPTFVQSVWFKLLCVAASLGVLSFLFLLRLRSLTARMQQRLYERLAERERIARDLHDTFFQGIQGLFLRVNTGTAMLPANEPARRILVDALEQSDRVMAEGRELVLDLRADDTVTANLAEDLSRVDPQSFGVAAPAYQVTAVGQVRRLHPVSSSELLRIGLEAVHNAFKHANATAVEVEILYEKDFLKMRIRDDGQGIDEIVIRDGRRPGHLGLIGMNERAERIGARYSLWSKRGQGTEIEVEVPAKIAYAARGGYKR